MLLDRYLQDPFFNTMVPTYRRTAPKTAAYDWYVGENEELIVTMEIPGVKRKDVNVSVTPEDNLLTVETNNRSFRRTVSSDYDLSGVTASLEDGILEVVIPAKEKEVIDIKID